MTATQLRGLRQVAYRRGLKQLGAPTAVARPYVIPGAPALLHRRWQRMLDRAPVVSARQHAMATGIGEIEEVTGCLLCGHDRVQALFTPRHPGGRWEYRVVRCHACGLLYRNPGIRPERLGALYERDYSAFLTGAYAKDRTRRYRLSMDALAPLFEDGSGRRLLDFGCGVGVFLELAHQRGFETYGVDLSPDSVAEARRRPGGARAYTGAPEDVPEIAAGGFDVITLWSVIAHLPRPVDTLRTLRGLLRPDGVLALMTVNANSLLLKARRDRWNGFTRNHLAIYSPDTLPRTLDAAGFAAVVLRPSYGDPVEAGATDLAPALQQRLRRTVDDGNQGNMLRAVAFADPDGPARWAFAARR